AHLDLGDEGGPTVLRVRGPDLCVRVRDPVGVPRAALAQVVAAVVPGQADVAGGRIQGDGRIELAVRGAVVVHPDRWAPVGSVVVRVLDHDVHVVALVRRLLGPDLIQAADGGAASS